MNCKNEATMFPVIVLVAKGQSPARAELQMGLNLCQAHCLSDTREYIADDGWTQIDGVFMTLHKTLPDHEASYIDFKPLEDRMPRL